MKVKELSIYNLPLANILSKTNCGLGNEEKRYGYKVPSTAVVTIQKHTTV